MNKVDAAIAAKKERLIEKADHYFSDGSHILYEKTADNMTNVDIRKAIESAQSVIEVLSVWLAINNGEVD